jgi:hypothetical protein
MTAISWRPRRKPCFGENEPKRHNDQRRKDQHMSDPDGHTDILSIIPINSDMICLLTGARVEHRSFVMRHVIDQRISDSQSLVPAVPYGQAPYEVPSGHKKR